MRKPNVLTVLIGMMLLAAGALTACEDDEEVTGLQAAQEVTEAGEEGHHGPHGPWDPERHLARLQEELSLTDAQVAELRSIFEEQRERFRALRESLPEDREARREAFKALREETHERVSAVLTEEQRQRLEELHASHGHGSQGHRGPHGPRSD